ncbi:MAG: hypothetical protein II050_06440, partial [Bacteroidaceae bacterium]|nr:hypothetical protein [Bacteroidaceae bacterium]
VGTRNDGYVEYTLANGYDEAGMKSRICHVTGFEYSEVGQIPPVFNPNFRHKFWSFNSIENQSQ